MALTKTEIVDKVEVVDNGLFSMVQVRTATVIKEDDQELSKSFHRHVVAPTDDWSGESDKVKAICDSVHTEETKKAYVAFQSDSTEP